MSKSPRKTPRKAVAERVGADQPPQADFEEVLSLIDAARTRALAAVNTALIDLYWQIGEYISRKIAAEGWGKGTVEALAEYIQRRQPGMTGLLGKQPVADAAVLRDLPRCSQNSHHWCENCPGPTTCSS